MKKNLFVALFSLLFLALMVSCGEEKKTGNQVAESNSESVLESVDLEKTDAASEQNNVESESPAENDGDDELSLPTKGLEWNIQDYDLAKSKINPFRYAVDGDVEYGPENYYKTIYEYPEFYFIGMSKDSKAAYCTKRNVDGRGGSIVEFFIQDLVTDKIVWSDKLDLEECDGATILQEYIKSNYKKINEQLYNARIVPAVDLDWSYEKLPVTYGGKKIKFTVNKELVGTEYDFLSVIDYAITASDGNKSKTVTSEKNVRAEDVYLCGFIKSPFENRIMLIFGEERYVFEGSEIYYKTCGCALNSGF